MNNTYHPGICASNGFFTKNQKEREYCNTINTDLLDCRCKNSNLPYEAQIGRSGRPSTLKFEFSSLSNDCWKNDCTY